MTKQSTTRRPTHTRRIVLYGRPSSGKTCFLAALAMPRLPHPAGYSCIWVNDSKTIPRPDGDESQWDPNDPAVGRYLGLQWLHGVIKLLNKGDVPPATPNAPPYRLLFDITEPDGKITRLEMVDYSGELVDPNLAEDEFARQLLAHLNEADGIIVLAEAPRANAESDSMRHAHQYGELQILQQAMALVAEERRKGRADPIPVVMLLNKWDRYSRMPFYDLDAAAIEADEFLNQKPPVPQKVLFNVLRAVAGALDGEPFSAKYPVSAFGQTRTVQRQMPDGQTRSVEVPLTLTPLQSYGLEDPLLWVCQKADQIEMHKLEANLAGLATWKVWQAVGRRALRVRSEIVEIKQRIPSHLPESKKLGAMAWQALAAFGKQTLFALFFFAALLFVGIESAVVAYDNHRYAGVYPAIQAARDPNSSPVDWASRWRDAATFLGSYPKAEWWRLGSHTFLLTPDSARKVLVDIEPQLRLAEKILAVQAEFDATVGGAAQSAEQTYELVRAEELRRVVDTLPLPEVYPLAGKVKAEGLAKIDARIELIRRNQYGNELQVDYQNRMRANQFAQAADLLASKAESLPTKVEELRGEFRKNCVGELTQAARTMSEAEDWPRAQRMINDLLGSREAVSLIGVGRRQCDDLRERIREHQANRLFNNWREEPNNPIRYGSIQQNGDASGRTVSTRWKEYQDYVNTPRDWTLKLDSIYVRDHYATFNRTDADVTCYVGGNYLTSESVVFTVRPETNSLSASGTISGKRFHDAVTGSIRYRQTNWTYPAPGESSWSGKISEMLREKSVSVSISGSPPNPEVKFHIYPKVGSVPDAPTLPPRRKDDF